jgi:hypothetical protein
MDKERVLETVDEAWLRRDFPVKGQPGVFEVEMGRIIGERGETVVRVVVDPATNEVVSAYPILSRQAVGMPR